MVDHPGCQYWRELADYYPQAKVLHTVRDPQAWFASTQATIFSPISPATNPPPQMKPFFESVFNWYGGDLHDQDFMVDFFNRHTEAVKAAIPAERLLVWDISDGWGPVCEFLEAQMPDTPIPRENTREQFQARAASRGAGGGEHGPN